MRKGTGNLKSPIQGYSLSIRYGDPYEDSVSFVSEYCMIASFLLTLGLLGLTWATSDDYDEEQALRMWRLNSLSYCSQETLSVVSITLYYRRKWIVMIVYDFPLHCPMPQSFLSRDSVSMDL